MATNLSNSSMIGFGRIIMYSYSYNNHINFKRLYSMKKYFTVTDVNSSIKDLLANTSVTTTSLVTNDGQLVPIKEPANKLVFLNTVFNNLYLSLSTYMGYDMHLWDVPEYDKILASIKHNRKVL